MFKRFFNKLTKFFKFSSITEDTIVKDNADKLCFISIGGGGGNILDDIMALNNQHTFIYMDNDKKELKQKKSPYKILVMKDTKPLIDDIIKKKLSNLTEYSETVYIIATLGRNFGSDVTPLIIEYLKTLNKKVIVFTTLPFKFEGKKCLDTALQSQDEIKLYADEFTSMKNDDILQYVDKDGMKKAFKMLSETIYEKIKQYQ